MTKAQDPRPETPKEHTTIDHGRQPALGRLAARISSWTSKCVLTGVVLVAGLGFGRQVLRWWRAEPAPPAAMLDASAAAGDLGDPAQLHVLRFADQAWSLRRQSVSGSAEDAAQALRAICRQALRDGAAFEKLPAAPPSELFDRLAATPPVEQEAGKWRLYQCDEALPMVVGIADTPPSATPRAVPKLAKSGACAVIWGLGVPLGLNAWALYSFERERRSGTASHDLPNLPIPPESRGTLSMGTRGGGAVVGFEGATEPGIWKGFYQRWFATQGWAAMGSWQHSDPAWHARFAPPPASRGGWVDVSFTRGTDGHSSGLLISAPAPQ